MTEHEFDERLAALQERRHCVKANAESYKKLYFDNVREQLDLEFKLMTLLHKYNEQGADLSKIFEAFITNEEKEIK